MSHLIALFEHLTKDDVILNNEKKVVTIKEIFDNNYDSYIYCKNSTRPYCITLIQSIFDYTSISNKKINDIELHNFANEIASSYQQYVFIQNDKIDCIEDLNNEIVNVYSNDINLRVNKETIPIFIILLDNLNIVLLILILNLFLFYFF